MKLTQLTEQKERPYICVHAKKGKHETHAVSSYDAAKNAAKHWGMKSTAGIDAHLAEGNYPEPRKMEVTQADKDNNTEAWKRFKAGDPRYEWKDMILSKAESYDDYHGDMSKEEYDKTVKGSQMEYTVWVGGTEVNDKWLNYEEAKELYDLWRAKGYDDVQLDARLKEGSFWGRDDMVAKMKKDYKAAGMRKYRKQDGGSYSGTTTSDPEEWERLEADGYEWDKDYYNDIEELEEAKDGMTDGTLKALQHLVDSGWAEAGNYMFGFMGSPYTADEWAADAKGQIDGIFVKHGSPVPPEIAKVYNGLVAYSKEKELQAERRKDTDVGNAMNHVPYYPENKDELYIRDNFAEQWYHAFYDLVERLGIADLDESMNEGAKPDFLDLDKDGDKKEPMKKAVKDKKAIKEEEEVYFNYEDIGGNIIVNPKSTITDQIGELLNRYYDISPMEFDPSKIEIQDIDESMNEDDDDGKLRLDPATGKYDPEEVKQMQQQGAEMARQKANQNMRDKLNRDIDVSQKAHTITVEYDLELDTPKSKNPLLKKHYQLMKKFNVFISMPQWEEGPPDSGFGAWFADVRGSKENLKGWLKAWEYDYDERDYEDMGLEESMNEDEEAIAARDEFMKVMDMKPKSSNKAIDTIKKIVADKQNMQVKFDDGKMKVDLYTASAVSAVYDAVKPETKVKIDDMLRTKEGMLKMSNFAFSKLSEGIKEGKRIDEILPALGQAAKAVGGALASKGVKGQIARGAAKGAVNGMIKDKSGKQHNVNSPQGKMIANMGKKVGGGTGATPQQVAQAKRDLTKNKIKAVGTKVKNFAKGALAKSADKSGFGNPLAASKQHANDMVEDAIKKAEKELEELSLSPSNIKSGSKITVKRVPSGYKAGSHHPPAKSKPRFKASVNF